MLRRSRKRQQHLLETELAWRQATGSFCTATNSIRHRRDAPASGRTCSSSKFDYDPDETYTLSLRDNEYLGPMFGLKDVVRDGGGEPIDPDTGVICATVRMGFGHYRIAMAGMSAARAMGFTPYWLDLLAIPGISSDVINWWNTNYSKFSRLSQRSKLFNKYVWESITTGDKTLPGLNWALNTFAAGWPWRFVKANASDYRMSELFAGLHRALPQETPLLGSHMWNTMGAVAGGMTHVVDMMFDNWPMAFQLIEGAKHGVQSPSGYYGFRVMRNFDDKGRMLEAGAARCAALRRPPRRPRARGEHRGGLCGPAGSNAARRAAAADAHHGRGGSATGAVQGRHRPLPADGGPRRGDALRQPRRPRRQLGVAPQRDGRRRLASSTPTSTGTTRRRSPMRSAAGIPTASTCSSTTTSSTRSTPPTT